MTRSSIPNPSGARPLVPNEDRRKKRPLWLALLAALIVAALIVLAIVLLARHHNKKHTAAPVAPVAVTTPAVTQSPSLDVTSASAVSSVPATTTAPVTTEPATTAPAAGTGDAGTLSANTTALLPAPAGDNTDLARYVGQKATAKGVLVLSAPADNGFWVGTSAKDEVWVQLLLPGLVSPHPVAKGDHVSFPGTVVANPANFAHDADVTAAEGAARLTAQKAHLQVAKTDVTFTK